MLDRFLGGADAPQGFADSFFDAFQNDPGGLREDEYQPLNDVALACEAFTPGGHADRFAVSLTELTAVCEVARERLRRISR